jgi:hypothetical protein
MRPVTPEMSLAAGDEMASTAASASSSIWRRGDHEVPLVRLYVLRAVAVLGIFGLFDTVISLVDHAPTDRGMIKAMLSGLWVMAFFAIRYPLKMVPLLLFEFVWKTIWLLSFGLPQWSAGVGSPRLSQDLWEIGAFPLVCALAIPWSYVWRCYVVAPSERWR